MSYTERGHIANANNLGILNAKISKYSKYDPSNVLITKTAIAAKNIAVNAILSKEDTLSATYHIQVKKRVVLFEPVNSKATRIGGSYASLDVSDAQIELVHKQVKVVRGERLIALKKAVPAAKLLEKKEVEPEETILDEAIVEETIVEETIPEETIVDKTTDTPLADAVSTDPVAPNTHSVSHTSYANNVRELNVLKALLETTPEYDPNEADLKVPAIILWIKDLSDSSDATDGAYNDLVAVNVERDELFYNAPDSVEKMVVKIKAAVLAAYGATSREYKDIKAIPFYDVRKKK